MRRLFTTTLTFLILGTVTSIAAETELRIVVDATELPRKLLHSQVYFTPTSESPVLLYPKWVPGIHAPRGPIENLAGLVVRDADNGPVEWKRDYTDDFRFIVDNDRKVENLRVDLRYICNQPTTNSKGIDSYGTPDIGVINWNTVFVYPEGSSIGATTARVELVLPSGWEHGSALPIDEQRGDTVFFEPVTLEQLVDRPLICGRNFRTIEFAKTDQATYLLHIAADHEDDLPESGDSTIVPLTRMAHEAEALFGRAHFETYHLLLTLSDIVPGLGLEHRNSSLNGVKASELRDSKWLKKRVSYLLPHEFAHSWVGKYRRPSGMYTEDFNQPKNTSGLWVYEGLDQLLGYVLTARCGYMDSTHFVQYIAATLSDQMRRVGRDWRPLTDTEVSAGILRGGSKSWRYLRRNQDYYSEGALHWLEFDAIIRNGTGGEKSLDDFCKLFFSQGDPDEHAVPFDDDDIVESLNAVYQAPWDSLIATRIYQTVDSFALDLVDRLGMTLEYTDSVPSWVSARESRHKYLNFYESLGFAIKLDGEISDVKPESPADRAGITPGATVIGVNGIKYSKERMKDAVKATADGRAIRLLVMFGERYEEVALDYAGGLRHHQLTPTDPASNMLHDIARPRTSTTN